MRAIATRDTAIEKRIAPAC
ncbi:hypothetical protein MJ524_18575 [Escherichia coli]|nr:hypothetical protein MJ524_18575 [Escherichia coli]